MITTSTTAQSTTSTSTSTTVQPQYDYQAELDRISHDIETKLKKQFDDLFVQLESKLDNFMKKCSEQKAAQDVFNGTVTKHLDYLVNNMQRFLKLASPATSSSHPLSGNDDGQT